MLLPLAGPANGSSTKERASSCETRKVSAGNVTAFWLLALARQPIRMSGRPKRKRKQVDLTFGVGKGRAFRGAPRNESGKNWTWRGASRASGLEWDAWRSSGKDTEALAEQQQQRRLGKGKVAASKRSHANAASTLGASSSTQPDVVRNGQMRVTTQAGNQRLRKVGAGVAFVAEQAIAATGATSEQQAEMREVTAARLRSTGKKNARDAGAASVDQTKMHGVVFEALYNGLLRCAAVKRWELLVALSFSCSKQCFLLEVNLCFTALGYSRACWWFCGEKRALIAGVQRDRAASTKATSVFLGCKFISRV